MTLSLLLSLLLTACAPGEFGAGARMANTIANGVACGMAAANGTPCTPQAVLDALARDAEAQREKVDAVAPQAAAVDPAQTQALLAELARNTKSNAALTKALLELATRPAPAQPSAPPVTSSAPSAVPTAPPAPTPSASSAPGS